jgi:hypothetical protein
MKQLFTLFLLSCGITNAQQKTTVLGTYKFDGKNEKPTTTVFQENDTQLIFYKADFDLDADGNPFAYHPKNTGLLHNANGSDKNGVISPSVVVYVGGKPYIQKATDPAPGYYLSMTSLHLQKYGQTDARCYVHPDSVTYFVLPGGKFKSQGVQVGDIGLVYNTLNKKYAYAIYADSGPGAIIGEGSTLLAKKLGLPVKINPKTGRIGGGLDTGDVLYIVFPSSGKGPKGYSTLNDAQVTELGKKAIQSFGTEETLIQRVLGFYNK